MHQRGNVHLQVTLAALAVTGCVVDRTDHLAGTIDDPVSISARWSLVDFATGATTPCPDGFGTALLVTQAVDDSGAPTAPANRTRFACSDGVGSGNALTEQVYQSWIEIRSDDQGQIYAQSIPQTFNVAKLDQPLTVTMYNDAGYAQLAWQLTDPAGHALDCGALTAPSMITVHGDNLVNPAATFDDHFVCEAGRAITHASLRATYAFTVSVVAASSKIGSSLPVTAAIADHNAVTDLGTITIPIPAPTP